MRRLLVLLLLLSPAAGAQPVDDAGAAGCQLPECPVDSADAVGEDSTLIASIVGDALSFLGTPYVYGGTGPSGFDCSGLIYRVFNDNGVPLPRTVGAIQELGVEVSREDLRPGDLLIFDSPRHIGLFIGDGEFIHSSSYLDRGVVVTPLDQPNYSRRYSGARRII